jgi:phosphoglycolate phosphatase-like HAD superfamily hydrolase
VADRAVIFDVDGVLLELTSQEEEIFFTALSSFVPTQDLSRDWNSYQIRNDEDIVKEILARNALPLAQTEQVKRHYVDLLTSSTLQAQAIKGAHELLLSLSGKAQLGIATANFLSAARHRLQQVGLWAAVADHAQGADGGGHKSAILGRLISRLPMKPQHIVYVGDNLNDVAAGLFHGVHFIGFSEDKERRDRLREAGAPHISVNHSETLSLISRLLA